MPLSRSEVRRRVKAARVLADYSRPESLAAHPVMKENGLTASRVIQIEAEKRDTPPMELRAIAEACGLPYEFFTADFATLANGTSETADSAVLSRLDEMDQAYREFIEDVRDTVIGTAGQIQNELDAIRLSNELPTQKLDQEDATPRARTGGRRRKP